ncbi:TonB-dependent receptor domain-containing protein [Lacinutrix gracilariae]|uniref:TonB-dependent receptor domain-containing protein n=1 Tax=Lacinutrix gracilariae TaxID=1747198 RepID=A0ABW5K455_9FLAO
MIKNYLVAMLLFFGFAQVVAQQQITGTVSDDTGPIPGASVVVKGTTTGTVTDFDGKYTIEAKNGDTLMFSYVGYDAKEVIVIGSVMDVTLQSGVALEEVVLVGSRRSGRTVLDSPVPIDVIDVKEVASLGAQTTVNEILNYVAPSFTSNAQTVSDGTDHVDPASLRGLGPDQVLVLINGKRRHKSSLVNVNGTVGTGTVGTDMNSIPSSAIAKIEVLRDGAAAQYGSDAIAGVINIVLKKATNELTLNVNSGANISKHSEQYDEGGIDGEKFQIDANYGVDLGKNGGYINFTGSLENRGATNRSDSMGQPIFTMFDVAARNLGYEQAYNMNPGALASYVAGLDPTLQAVYDQGVANGDSYLDIIASDGVTFGGDTSNPAPITEYELAQRGLTRDDFRMKIGQSKLRGGKFLMNMELPLDDSGSAVYTFGGISFRDGLGAGFYRRPAYTDGRGNQEALPNGFLPHIASKIIDKSLAAGIKGKIGDWDVDFSNTYGTNSFDFTIENTVNATLGTSSPREFEAGGFSFAQNTTNLDISKFYEDMFSGFNVAFGAEYRVENYQLIAGEEASWASYDVNGEIVTGSTSDADLVTSYFGNVVPGGAQVFPGYRPENEVNQNRNSYAGYVDLEADITEAFLLSTAFRYENYNDFGDTFNWKLASKYKFSDDFAVRAAYSTGFRAPDLHQIYFNATATQFVGGIPIEQGTFANNSRLAQLLEIPSLKEETSKNFSLGFTAKLPDLGLKFTVDGYIVNVEDRVGLTRSFAPIDAESQELFDNASATAAKFFTNGFDLDNKGIDLVIAHNMALGKGDLTNNLSATFREVEVKNVKEILGEEILDETLKGYIEDAMPRTKVNLTNTYKCEKWNVMLRNVYFGSVNDPDFRGTATPVEYGAKIVTDLSASYDLMDNLKITAGANNLFDIYPDEVPFEDSQYGDQFIFSRRTSQFGFNGRYVFGRLTFTLK